MTIISKDNNTQVIHKHYSQKDYEEFVDNHPRPMDIIIIHECKNTPVYLYDEQVSIIGKMNKEDTETSIKLLSELDELHKQFKIKCNILFGMIGKYKK